MNWGYKIAIVIGLFIFIMMSMVFVAFRQTNEMVDENYYEKEIKYQSKIDAAHLLQQATDQDIVKIESDGVHINLPAHLIDQFSEGAVQLLRSSDQKKDINLKLSPDVNGQFIIPADKLIAGKYKIRLTWKNNTSEYYKEEDIYVNK